MAETVRFHVPLVGIVSATLHQESEAVYRWLRETGEVDRLKRLDHLGAIRFAWEGAHHPRWEFIAVILSLIDQCRDHVPEAHLGSRARLPSSGEISSGSELLKCWTLLFNVGHLVWTFFAERALLLELWENHRERRQFLEAFPSNSPLKEWAWEILKRGHIYRFFQALAFIRLDSLAQRSQRPEPNVPWREILQAYALEQENRSGLARLREVYRGLRRVAYLTLDPHYTPAGVQLNATQVFPNHSPLDWVLPAGPAGTEEALTAMERYLYENIYLGEPVLQAMAAREPELRRKIRKSLRHNGLCKTVNDLAQGDLQEDICPSHLLTIARLPIWVERPFQDLLVDSPNARTAQKILASQLPAKLRRAAPVSIWPSADGSSWVVQFHAAWENRAAQVGAYCLAFKYAIGLKEKAEARHEWLDQDFLHELLFERLASELIIRALELIHGENENLRWEWRAPSEGPVAIIGTRTDCITFLKKIVKKAASRDENAELQGRVMWLRRRPKEWVTVSIRRLEAYKGWEKFCELDGCLVEIRGNQKVMVTVIEVKTDKKRGVSKARAQLEQTLKKLGVKCKPKTKKEKGFAIAWASVELNTSGSCTPALNDVE